jgi:hypothetical protein
MYITCKVKCPMQAPGTGRPLYQCPLNRKWHGKVDFLRMEDQSRAYGRTAIMKIGRRDEAAMAQLFHQHVGLRSAST